jgi:hypothetical protein
LRAKYRAPTYLMLNSLHDVLTLLLHTATEVAVYHQADSSRYRADYGVHSVADRIAGTVLREMMMDPLYRTLKLGLLLAPSMWPYLVSVWRLVITPWAQSPSPTALQELAALHERKQTQAALAYTQYSSTIGSPAGATAPPQEQFPFSTLVLSPFDPLSLQSPFMLPKRVGSAVVSKSSSSSTSMFSLGSLFGNTSSLMSSAFSSSPTPSSPSISSSTPSTTPSSSSLSSTATTATVISSPQNWGWFTFYDVTLQIGMWKKPPAVDANPAPNSREVADLMTEYR